MSKRLWSMWSEGGGCPGHHQPISVWPGILAGGPVPVGCVAVRLDPREARPPIVGPDLPPALRVDVVSLAWPDMDVPPFSLADWRAIAAYLQDLAGGRPIHVSCGVHHGRTGTALAILGSLWGHIPAGQDVVQAVRDAYCPRSVETAAQIRYLQSLGLTTTADPEMPPYDTSTVGPGPGAPSTLTLTPPPPRLCLYYDPRAHRYCSLPAGHDGAHVLEPL